MQNNKVAIVTGGGKRLGRAIAIALAENGFNVVVNYNKSLSGALETVNLIKERGTEAFPLKADISKKTDVNRLVNSTIKKFGRIDLLVNNSGIFTESSLLKTSQEIWDNTIDINLKGSFLCAQAVAPIMLKQKGGKIINISSVGGLIGWTNYFSYSISKAGVIMLTRLLAKELAPYVQVNTIAPGFIAIRESDKNNEFKMPKKKILLQKYGNIKDITDMVTYLSTKSEYITGQVIPIDGGRSIK
ncbi:MAG: SDR family oxidoreductase [Ignavibacteriales bacterium]|nr:SDR family oxidoreductase [Ignavibacteriales bacterium]